ncbi:hypothetical protein B9Q00_09865 [Candidatus Marsarchaeota G1 archaeon OSP_C]|uniref:Uncharacterized protein n=1 Tax=Candidatus Marsarchaeota G1 archaeon OSP_C TaxID=1978154 RepID=A0A2R6AL23_9ARCH|nr:MAG: hypothetical protein B9Q00_09865 [Candidatus Marsarchaeota G1 archaeon OSP_C]
MTWAFTTRWLGLGWVAGVPAGWWTQKSVLGVRVTFEANFGSTVVGSGWEGVLCLCIGWCVFER